MGFARSSGVLLGDIPHDVFESSPVRGVSGVDTRLKQCWRKAEVDVVKTTKRKRNCPRSLIQLVDIFRSLSRVPDDADDLDVTQGC